MCSDLANEADLSNILTVQEETGQYGKLYKEKSPAPSDQMASRSRRADQSPESDDRYTVTWPERDKSFCDDTIEGDLIVPVPRSPEYCQGLEYSSCQGPSVVPGDAAVTQLDGMRAAIQLQNGPVSNYTPSGTNHETHPAPFDKVPRDVGDNNDPDASSEYEYTFTSSSDGSEDNSPGSIEPKLPGQGQTAPRVLNPDNPVQEPSKVDLGPKEAQQGGPKLKASPDGDYGNLQTSSLMLVCFRSWSSVPRSRKITVGRPLDTRDEDGFTQAVKKWNEGKGKEIESRKRDPLITSGKEVVQGIRKGYQRHLRGIWRRIFSLKTVRSIRLRAVNGKRPHRRPVIVDMDPEATADLLFQILRRGCSSGRRDDDYWVRWVFNLSNLEGKRHQLEFVEGWSPLRLLIATSIPLLSSIMLGICWSVLTGDIQTGFALAGFVLTAGSSKCCTSWGA